MEKSFYFVLPWSDAKHYTVALKALDVEYLIETADEIPSLEAGQLAIVLPNLPVRIYDKVRTLFGTTGEPY